MTKHSCQELVETVSRRVCNHHVGCKLLAVENPHSVRHSPAMNTHRWNPMSKTRATAPCIRLLHLVGPQLVRTVNKWFTGENASRRNRPSRPRRRVWRPRRRRFAAERGVWWPRARAWPILTRWAPAGGVVSCVLASPGR